MMREAFAEEHVIRNVIVGLLDAIRESILYFKWYRPMQRERDPQKRLEKELLYELLGVRFDGMAEHGACASFKQNYYDRLSTDAARSDVRNALLRMLRYGRYSIPKKVLIAQACGDLGMDEAVADSALVREADARNMTMRQLLRFKRERARELDRYQGEMISSGRVSATDNMTSRGASTCGGQS